MLDEVQKQVSLACRGVEKHVKLRQRESGVKDAYTQFWIDDLIKRARAKKIEQPELSEDDIQADLMTWVHANTDIIYNPFFTLPGMIPHISYIKDSTHVLNLIPRARSNP